MKPTVIGLAAARASVGARAAARPAARNWRRVGDASNMGISSCPRGPLTISNDGEPVPQLRCRFETHTDVVLEQIALGHEGDGRGAHAHQIFVARWVALLDRRAGIAALLAVAPRPGERQRGAGKG